MAMQHDDPDLRARVKAELLGPVQAAANEPSWADEARWMWDWGFSIGQIAEQLRVPLAEVAVAIGEAQ